jgi:methylamine dehydrogenase accessory protein MauD
MEPVVLVSYVALWVVVVFQGLLLLGLVRAVAELSTSARRSGTPGVPNTARLGAGQPTPGALTGQPAPRFNAVDVLGGRVDSASFDGQRRLLVFVAPSCPSCQEVWSDIEALSAEYRATVVLVCVARAQPCRQFAEQHEVAQPLLVDGEAVLATAFGISVTPTAVLIDADNVVGPYRHVGRADDPTQALQQLVAQLSSLPQSADQQEAVRQ